MTTEALIETAAMQALAEYAAQVPDYHAIVEIGVHHAANLCSMATAAKHGHGAKCYGIDAYGHGDVYRGRPHMLRRYTTTDHQTALATIKAAKVTRHTKLVVATSTQAATDWTGPPIALLVIDAEHRYASVLADYHAWAPHLAPNARIAFDDYGGHYGAEVKQAVDHLITTGDLATVDHAGTRLIITRPTCHAKAAPPAADTEPSINGSGESTNPPLPPDTPPAGDADNPSGPANPGTSDTTTMTAPSTAGQNTADGNAQPAATEPPQDDGQPAPPTPADSGDHLPRHRTTSIR